MPGSIADEACSHVERLERELLDPAVRADSARLDALLADDFMEIGASGAVFGRDVALRALPVEENVRFEAGPMRVRRMTTDVICVNYEVTRVRDADACPSLRSSWWRREPDGRWRMVFHQGTPHTGLGTIGE